MGNEDRRLVEDNLAGPEIVVVKRIARTRETRTWWSTGPLRRGANCGASGIGGGLPVIRGPGDRTKNG